MKKTSFKVVGGLALLAVSSIAMASVVNTKHNLGATHPTGVDGNHTNATTEICIFCHTPHGGDQTTFAPIWNRATGTASYQRFSSLGRLTFDAKEAPIGAVSAACLSCHDGTQGIDSVINSPGSDTTGNVSSDPSASGLAAATGGTGGFSQSNIMSNGFASADGAWDGTLLPRGDMVYLGTDLRNDHPISMQYAGGGLNSATPNGATVDPDFAQNSANSVAAVPAGNKGGLWNAVAHTPLTLTAAAPSNAQAGNTTGAVNGSGSGLVMHDMNGTGGTDRWWVSTTNNATYTAEDFPLYSRTDVTGGGGLVQPTVECGTCHDPHSGNRTFLRLPDGNAGSQVCLTCHAK